MVRLFSRTSHKAGMAPGSLVYVGDDAPSAAKITLLTYNELGYTERIVENLSELAGLAEGDEVAWIDIEGVGLVKETEKIGALFNIHPLVLEDVLNSGQRPKLEVFDEMLFVVLRSVYHNRDDDDLYEDQVSVILMKNIVITFHGWSAKMFEPIRKRIKETRWRARRLGADYLAYAIADTVVDHHFVILEKIGERLEDLEDEVVNDPTDHTLQNIHRMKQFLLLFRKACWPMRDIASHLMRGDTPLVKRETETYLRDLHDHSIQVIDTVESFRDMVAGLLDIYLSSLSNRTNEVMKVLTIIATIFIPLTFIAGIYGMNFSNMPELQSRWGYPVVWAVMLALAVWMVSRFRRRGWL